MSYKTVRISYATKEESRTDVAKYFSLDQGREITRNDQISGRHLLAKFPECHGYFIDDVTVDILCPDDFDVSQLGGTIVRSDGEAPLHEWMGHEQARMVVDKEGTTEEPVKVRTVTEEKDTETTTK